MKKAGESPEIIEGLGRHYVFLIDCRNTEYLEGNCGGGILTMEGVFHKSARNTYKKVIKDVGHTHTHTHTRLFEGGKFPPRLV